MAVVETSSAQKKYPDNCLQNQPENPQNELLKYRNETTPKSLRGGSYYTSKYCLFFRPQVHRSGLTVRRKRSDFVRSKTDTHLSVVEISRPAPQGIIFIGTRDQLGTSFFLCSVASLPRPQSSGYFERIRVSTMDINNYIDGAKKIGGPSENRCNIKNMTVAQSIQITTHDVCMIGVVDTFWVPGMSCLLRRKPSTFSECTTSS